MKPIVHFLRTTLLGGVLFFIPIVTLAFILGKAFELASKFAAPLASHFPDGPEIGIAKATVLAIILTVLLCFLAGLMARTALARTMVDSLEKSVLSNVPAYEYLKLVSHGALGLDEAGSHTVVLVLLDAWQIGIKVEELESGLIAVFVPDAPNPNSGGVYFVTPDRLKLTGAPLVATLNCLKRLGAGSNALLRDISIEMPPP